MFVDPIENLRVSKAPSLPYCPYCTISVTFSAMVSGHGFKGYGRGRCYTLWQDFMACITKHHSYGAGICQLEREDYIECLHHGKLVSKSLINSIVL